MSNNQGRDQMSYVMTTDPIDRHANEGTIVGAINAACTDAPDDEIVLNAIATTKHSVFVALHALDPNVSTFRIRVECTASSYLLGVEVVDYTDDGVAA